MTLWPIVLFLIGGTVYGNSETIKRWVHGPDDVVPVEIDQHEYNSKINAKFLELEESIAELKEELAKVDDTNRSRLQSQINSNKKEIEWLKN